MGGEKADSWKLSFELHRLGTWVPHSPVNKVCAKEGMVTYCCDPSTQEAEAGGTWEYPGPYGETLSPKQNENKNAQFSDFYLVSSESRAAARDI